MTNSRRKVVEAIEAPSNLGLSPPRSGKEPGTRLAPDSLAAAGLYELVKPKSLRRVEPPLYPFGSRGESGVKHDAQIRTYSRDLADAIEPALVAGNFPLVIGGDCSVLIGAGVALKRLGEYGLLFIDGHTDFYLPEQSPSGGAAGLDLAIVTGWGPSQLTNIDGLRPYFLAKNVMTIGHRFKGALPPAPIPTPAIAGMEDWPLDRWRKNEERTRFRQSLDRIARSSPAGVWMHVDVDVLDSQIMPAVDSLQPDGLSWNELAEIISGAFETTFVCGMTVCIFDPSLDTDQSLSQTLARNIATWLTC